MHFTKAISAAFFSALYLAGGVHADDCQDGPFERTNPMGYPGRPNHFCQTAWKSGQVVRGLEVWATRFQIKGVQLTYADGTRPPVMGQASGERHQFIEWDPKTPIRVMKVNNNKHGDAIGSIYMEVGDKKLWVSSDQQKNGEREIPLGSGLLLGHSGDQGAYITQWTPLFMGTVYGKAEITAIKFDADLNAINNKMEGIESMVVGNSYIVNSNPPGPANSTDLDQVWSYDGQHTVESSTTFSSTSETVFNFAQSFEVGAEIEIPLVAKFSAKSTTSMGFQMSDAQTSSFGRTISHNIGTKQGSSDDRGLIKPGHAMNCSTAVIQGTYKSGYTSTVRISVNGNRFDIQRRGTFEGVSWSTGTTQCKDILVSDIPEGAEVHEAKDTYQGPSLLSRVATRAVKFVA